MARLYADSRSMAQIFATSAVKMGGNIPQHVAFIMDGNRRYAKSHGLATKHGHDLGRLKTHEISRWGIEMNIPEVSYYAFSIENFKRSKTQVDELMSLFISEFEQMVNDLDTYKKDGFCIQFIGNLDLIPFKLKTIIAKIMCETRHGKNFKLNIALSYTGRNVIDQSLQTIQAGMASGLLESQDMSEYLLEESMYLTPMRPVDIMIRTGGDKRISDFMMWEASHAYIHFIDATWPEITFWSILDAIIKYQMFRRSVPKLPLPRDALTQKQKQKADQFIEEVREIKWGTMKQLAQNSPAPDGTGNRVAEETVFREAVKQLLNFS